MQTLKHHLRVSIWFPWAASLALAVCVTPAIYGQQSSSSPASSNSASAPLAPQALVNRYCIGCHNQKVKTAGISLQGLDPEKAGENSEVWEKVLRKVSAGQMPPAGLPHPAAPVTAAFCKTLETGLDRAAAANPNPGHPSIHRLNRAEYSNAIRDLLALDIKPGSKLPADDSGYGFDNIGEVLSLSPVLIERYMSVARLVSRLAVGDKNAKPQVDVFDSPRETSKVVRASTRVSDNLPFDSAGGLAVDYYFPVDAEYVIKVKTPAVAPATEPQVFEVRMPVKAGSKALGVTFLAEGALPENAGLAAGGQGAAAAAGGGRPTPSLAKMDIRLDGVRVKLYDVPHTGASPRVASVSIAGPYNVTGPGNTPSRQKIFVCTPTSAKDEDTCARQILSTLGRRAYRRPFTKTDLSPLMAFYQTGHRESGFEGGIQLALRAMLVSPDFLFRIERDPEAATPGSVYKINDFELASRLSFFLWSSIPDDELLSLAEQGKLHDSAVLSKQVDRMLDDRRSQAFVSNFAGQWLFLRNLAQVRPDQDVFPKFDSVLRRSFQRETELFFTAILNENRPITDLLSADFTYLNQPLAEHYGVPNVYGSQFRRVTMKDGSRGGLLGQGSILTVTSYPNRTSVVQRGKWVLENLLGTPPPPPPPDIPALEAHSKEGKALTVRQQMEQHRKNPTCASCHSRMDPIGFSLENFDGVGAWRNKDAGSVIDASGKLPDGTVFEGPAGLKKVLLTGHKDEFVSTFTQKLMTYALGRGLESYDMPAMRSVIRDAATQNSSIPAFIHAVVNSSQFQTRKSRES